MRENKKTAGRTSMQFLSHDLGRQTKPTYPKEYKAWIK